jgi:hypothetical protein
MPLPIAKRLSAERHRQFVGRQSELELFQGTLEKLADYTSLGLAFHVLHIYGPGGVGKTSLLRQFVRLGDQYQVPVIYIDARNLEPVPASFLRMLQVLVKREDAPLPIVAEQLSRHVLLLDTYEMFTPLDEWLREEFLPQLPENTLTIIAGRQPPTPAWRTDPGWQSLIRPLPLRNLNPEESQTYLDRRAVPASQHQSVFAFTYGHPLALSLVADMFAQGKEILFLSEAAPNDIKMLLDRFVQDLPTPAHGGALEACAIARQTTESSLRAMLDQPDVRELFEWLWGLSFIESGVTGLFPHDLARDVLIADLRWRNPDGYVELHQRARNYYMGRLEQAQAKGQEQHSTLFDYIFLHRDNPSVRPRFTWQEHSSLFPDRLRKSDRPILLDIVTRHEGAASAHLAAHWFDRQPHGVLVSRDAEQQVVGLVLMVNLHEAHLEDLETDPASIACWRYLQMHAPLRRGEGATLFRLWMARDTYQDVSPTQSLIFINLVQYYLTTPGLAYTFLPCANPEDWAAMFAYADLARLPEADFEVGGQRYGVYGHDWRVVPPAAWQDLLARREISASADVGEQLCVLSQPEFIEAVQEALRHFKRLDVLSNNPLIKSRIVVDQAFAQASGDRVVILQTLVQAAVDALQASSRDDKLYHALHHTYICPAPSQERAAERLDLPFSTYRRHLKAGVMRVAEILWHREIG